MTPTALDRVFGRSRLKMVTGPYVEVYREGTPPGARRRYTKRFIKTRDGDFREWTEREWRILARLVGHGARHVPDVVQYDRGAGGGDALVQTYDAGITVDHWATLLPVQRGGRVLGHIFQDCAHWWALARHLLLALHEIHALRLVHLDLKADNICLPFAPPSFHPAAVRAAEPEVIFPVFEHVALIDFAFSLISGEALTSPLPIGWQRTFAYQSPRLLDALEAGQKGNLEPTRQLDWRCDMFSLAALLTCYLPLPEEVPVAAGERGWTAALHAQAERLLSSIRSSHDRDVSGTLPHLDLAAACAVPLQTPALAESLSLGWSLAADLRQVGAIAPTAPLTPVTLIEPAPPSAAPVTAIFVRPHESAATAPTAPADRPREPPIAGAIGPSGAADHPALATLPAVHAALPSAPWGAVDIADAGSGTTDEATTLVAPEAEPAPAVDVEVVPPAAVTWIEQPAVAAPGTATRDEIVAASPRQRPRAASLTYGLPLLGLLAGAVWLVTGPGESSRPEASNAAHSAPQMSGAAATPPAAAPGDPVTTAAPTVSAPAVEPRKTAVAAATTRDTQPLEAPPALPPAAAPWPVVPDVGNPIGAARGAADPRVTEDRHAKRARGIVAAVVPVVVERAAPRVGEVLAAAAQAQSAADDRRTRAAAKSIGDTAFTDDELRLTTADSSARARHLNAAAHRAFWQSGDVARAFELQWQAFGAQPRDAEIAGNLAFYAMKLQPRQVEMARGLAIYALAAATRSTGPSRLEDWGSLAVASALSGRAEDSANAMLVLLTVSKDVDRSCRSALSSVASFGPALREPAQALLTRVNARGAAHTPYCAWPPKWSLGSKLP